MDFLIKSGMILLALWLLYKLVFESTSLHHFKRIYLLASLAIAIVIPQITTNTVLINAPVLDYATQQFQAVPATSSDTIPVAIVRDDPKMDFWESQGFFVLMFIYLLGAGIMLIRFLNNLRSFRLLPDDKVSCIGNYLLVEREKQTAPYSFWSRIFVSQDWMQRCQNTTVVLTHEKAHLDQRHSIDILIIELLLILLWFNPVLYLIRYSMRLNHEFLADQEVLKSNVPVTEYQELLVDQTYGNHHHFLANSFNFPLIKKRLTIMNTTTSTTSSLLRLFLILPLVTILAISCGKEKTVVKQEPIYIDNNSPEGTIEIARKTYRYTNNSNGIIIYDHNGQEINYNEQGWDIRERLVVPNFETDSFNSMLVPDGETRYFIDDQEISQADFLIKYGSGFTADVMSHEKIDGVDHYYLENINKSDTLQYGLINKKYSSSNEKEAEDFAKYFINGNRLYFNDQLMDLESYRKHQHIMADSIRQTEDDDGKKTLYIYGDPDNVIPRGQYSFTSSRSVSKNGGEPLQSGAIARTVLNAMNLRYADTAVYYLEKKKSDYDQVLNAISSNPKLGFKLDLEDRSQPSLYAGKDLPHTTQELQDSYSRLFKGMSQTHTKYTLEYYGESPADSATASSSLPVDTLATRVSNWVWDEVKRTSPDTVTYTKDFNKNNVSNSKESWKETKFFLQNAQGEQPEKPKYTLQEGYVFKTINGTRGNGSFKHQGNLYYYKMPTDYDINILDSNKRQLGSSELKKLKFVFTPIWDSKKDEAALKKETYVKKMFESGRATLFYSGGYTDDYQEFLKYDFGNTYITKYLEQGNLKINLVPVEWKKTNHSLIEFFENDNL